MASLNRRWVQIIAAIGSNGYWPGFRDGAIYQGNLKKVCVPGLNCYSCPGALGSCPIGSLQAVIGSINYTVSFYIIGFLTLTGSIMGRLVCGWLCPFGLIQELFYKIPAPKMRLKGLAANLKYLKYVILAVFVIILPALWVNSAGMGAPAFCKYICPAGTLEGGIPWVLFNPSLRSAAGFLFVWKMVLLVLTVTFSILIFRPFCRVFCPLGAVYALFAPVSLYRYQIDEHRCTRCGTCVKACKMDVVAFEKPNDPECIRCGDCIKSCPQGAIRSEFLILNNSAPTTDE